MSEIYSKKGVSLSYYISILFIISILIFNINYLIPHYIFFMWLVSVLFFDSKRFLSILRRRYFLAFLCFLIYYFISSLNAFSLQTCFNRVFTMLELLSPFVMYELYGMYDDKKKKLLCIVFLVMFVINSYQMMQTINISVVEGLKQHFGDEGYLNTAFHYIYGLTLVFCLLIYVIRKRHTIKQNNNGTVLAFSIIWLSLIGFVVIQSMNTTAILLLGIGTLLAYLYKKKNWIIKLSIMSVILIVIFNNVVPYFHNQMLSTGTDYATISYRLEDISNFMTKGSIDDATSFGSRFYRSINSLNTFAQHPLFGVNHMTNNRTLFEGDVIGNHAEWVDSLAQYGFFALLLFYVLIQSAKNVAANRNLKVVFLLYIMIGFFNPVLYCIQNSICFYIIPFFYDLLLPSDSINKNNSY